MFVTKLNSLGSGLVYSTYLGGSDVESGRGISVDAAGNAFVAGSTASVDFPTVAGALRNKSPFFKSLNGGATWGNDNNGLVKPTDVLAIDPTNPNTIYAGAQESVYKSTNGGRTWVSKSNGLNSPRVIRLIVDPVTPSTLYLADGFTFNSVSSTRASMEILDHRQHCIGGGTTCLAIDPVTNHAVCRRAWWRIRRQTALSAGQELRKVFVSSSIVVDP